MSSTGIPSGWTIVTIEDVADILAGYGFPESLQGRASGDFPFYKVGDISEAWKRNQTVLSCANHYITNDELRELRAKPLPSGTTVFAKIGAAIALNRRAMLGTPSLVDNNVMGLSPLAGLVHPKFLFYFVCTLRLDDLSRSTTVPSIRKSDVAAIRFPLVPIIEQRRIAEEIEALLTDVDAAVAALKRVKANLKRYRASVLKAACEGRLVLTEAELARKEGRTYETGQQLLERILEERRAKWEADQLTKMLAASKPPSDDEWKKKRKEPDPPDTTNLPELPEGWTWASLNQLGEVNRGKSKHRPRNDPKLMGGPYPFVQTGDVKHSRGFIRQHTQTYSELGLAQSRLWPEGTLCITIAANIADTGILTYPACFPDSIVGFIPQYELLARFVQLFMATAKENLERYAPATAQKNINLEILSDVAVPLPPQAEQVRIVNEAEQNLTAADDADSATDRETRRSDRLRQAILERAFEGNLVPQDPNDEPASVLLERIRAQRAATPALSGEAGKGKRGVRTMARQHKDVRRSVLEVLKEAKSAMSPESLFAESGNTPDTIEEFYAELKAGIDSQQIEQLRPDSASVLLRAKQS